MTTKPAKLPTPPPHQIPEPGTPAAAFLAQVARLMRPDSDATRPPIRPAPSPHPEPSGEAADLLKRIPQEQLDSLRRCYFRDPAGRRCRRDRMHNHPTYCYYHSRPQQESDLPADSPQSTGNAAGPPDSTLEDLLGPLQDYRTAAGVNFTLGRLLLLVADNRVSARKAHLIAYICQLLLQSVPAVAKEVGMATNDDEEREDLSRVIRATRSLFGALAPDADPPESPQTTSCGAPTLACPEVRRACPEGRRVCASAELDADAPAALDTTSP